MVIFEIFYQKNLIVPVKGTSGVQLFIVHRADGQVENSAPRLDVKPGFNVTLPSAGTSICLTSSISITPYQMAVGDARIVAERIHATLSNPPASARFTAPAPVAPPVADLSGQWDVHIEYLASASNHTLHLKQTGSRFEGTHQGDFVSRDLSGTIDGNRVQLSSSYTERHGDSLSFRFSGTVAGDTMAGTLDMGEYLSAKWTAKRHDYRRG